jgi:hypothetical protein
MSIDDFPIECLVHDILKNDHFFKNSALKECLHLFDFNILV